MNVREEQRDLFTVPKEYYLVHCISGDYALGAGIAVQFAKKYNMKYKLYEKYPIPDGDMYAYIGKALLVDNVFNLVTKVRYFKKPAYNTLYATLVDMKEQCRKLNITKLAMPRIGCGLDRLKWDNVKEIIEEVFKDTDIEILVCSL